MCPQRVFGAFAPASTSGSLVAIGNFDGVHRGHQAIIGQALALARAASLEPLVLTFDPHPSQVLGRGTVPVLTTLERRVELLRRQSESLSVVVEPFTLPLAQMEPTDFARTLLVEGLRAKTVIVGEDFRFGRGRSGDFRALSRLGDELGFRACAAKLETEAEAPISSTRVRNALERGALDEAEALLGRPHSLTGLVVPGQGKGRTIGVPTANLSELAEAPPPHGVYAVLVDRRTETGFEALAGGVANFGVRPTLGAGPSFEAHLFDVSADLYGQELRVHLLSRLREERKFSGLPELVAQIARDMDEARALTATRKPDPRAHGAWY